MNSRVWPRQHRGKLCSSGTNVECERLWVIRDLPPPPREACIGPTTFLTRVWPGLGDGAGGGQGAEAPPPLFAVNRHTPSFTFPGWPPGNHRPRPQLCFRPPPAAPRDAPAGDARRPQRRFPAGAVHGRDVGRLPPRRRPLPRLRPRGAAVLRRASAPAAARGVRSPGFDMGNV